MTTAKCPNCGHTNHSGEIDLEKFEVWRGTEGEPGYESPVVELFTLAELDTELRNVIAGMVYNRDDCTWGEYADCLKLAVKTLLEKKEAKK